ncbi:MAG: type II toxin-antitoxin system VapC family toxin [Verrucomicrobia bacterium]|nr:type II toxin-antitoxin system VapC family toxin [Verrucomicrobiota bacterium]
MTAYADSSFLVAIYLLNIHSAKAAEMAQRMGKPLPFTVLNRLELRNAIHLSVFRREIDAAKRLTAFKQIEEDIRTGRLTWVSITWTDVFREAERLADEHSATLGTRSLDILHVAAAWILGATEFLTFDRRQAGLAKSKGFMVRP